MLVMKFGGTSVQDAAAVENACKIIASRSGRKPLVVVSACSGVTNALIGLAHAAADDKRTSTLADIRELRDRHIKIAKKLLTDSRENVLRTLRSDFGELERLLQSISVLRHLTPRALDQCAA